MTWRYLGAMALTASTAVACAAPTDSRVSGSNVEHLPAVRGPSLLTTLGLEVDATTFGQAGGLAPPAPTDRREPMPPMARGRGFRGIVARLLGRSWSQISSEPFVLTGGDLYRIACQSCHGPDGEGAAPEVNSLVGPVTGTSTELLIERMREKSRPIDVDFLRDVTAGAEDDLRQRLREGGEKMPPFGYLADDAVDALVGYLQRMVGTPEAPEADARLMFSAVAVGQLVVNGNCHICHDATGPGRHAMMMQGVVPSLASMPQEEAFDDLVAKVREGVSPRMMMRRTEPSKMPQLPYLTEQELAAAILYLTASPPQP